MVACRLNDMLVDSVDRCHQFPAVACGDHETDFERLDESVEWLAGDLEARGVQSRQRVGLCISGGWEFVLAFHALVRLDVVVVPIDPFDTASLRGAGDLDLHSVVSHRGLDSILEEMTTSITGRAVCPTFDVADEFTLVVVSSAPLHRHAGLIMNDVGYQFWPSAEVAERVDGLRVRLELDSGARAVICGPWSCPCAVLLVLACAASGSCVQMIPESGGGEAVLEAVATGDVSVVFARPVLMHDVVRGTDVAARGVSDLPRVMLPHGEVLPEVVQRRSGLTRPTTEEPAIYEFGPAAAVFDEPPGGDAECVVCGSLALLTVS